MAKVASNKGPGLYSQVPDQLSPAALSGETIEQRSVKDKTTAKDFKDAVKTAKDRGIIR
tara:strand:+ start:891 stop:1067 length:177 start_codon:yes stop_codon:yes gene_type:complete